MQTKTQSTMNNINIQTQSVTGRNNEAMNVGYALICLRHDQDRIVVDDFVGAGSSYKRRETQLIEVIENGEVLFSGSKYELFEILRNAQSNENA